MFLSDAEAKLFGVGDERNACCFRVMTHSPSWAPKVKGQPLAAAALLTVFFKPLLYAAIGTAQRAKWSAVFEKYGMRTARPLSTFALRPNGPC